jgi:hypothetical protein
MKLKRLCLLNVRVRLAGKKEGSMAFYAIDLRDGVIQRVTQECYKVDNERFFLIEAGSAKQAWTKASSAPETNGSAVCDCCRHRLCSFCEDCSAAKQYSDYWICHRCGELNRRVPKLHLKGVSNGLGEI